MSFAIFLPKPARTFLAACLFVTGAASAHQVETVEFEFQKLDKVWRLHGEMDIAYMLPETRWVPGGGPLSRKEVMQAPPAELQRIRRETENTLREMLRISHGGETLKWRIEFPDFNKQPLVLPEDLGDWALLTVNLVVDEQHQPGELKVHWSHKEKAELILLVENSGDPRFDIPVSIEPGGELAILKVTAGSGQNQGATVSTSVTQASSFWSWVKSGYRHVLPKGADHMLFIFGLFVAVLKLRPMLWQSLLFTLSHSLTLAACALGWISFDGRWVEIFIAFSIAFIGVEDLLRCKVGKRRYITVFVFGLVHGMGFASVLAEQVRGIDHAQLVQPLLGFNLGVELAQMTVVIIAFLLFLPLSKKRKKTAQVLGSLLVTIAGIGWMIERIFFA